MYASTQDLPIVCQMNLPPAAQSVYRSAFNRAWKRLAGSVGRYRNAQESAWTAVRRRFEKDAETGGWMAKPAPIRTRLAATVPVPAFEPIVAEAV